MKYCSLSQKDFLPKFHDIHVYLKSIKCFYAGHSSLEKTKANYMITLNDLETHLLYTEKSFCHSMIRPLKVVNISLATYGDIFIEKPSFINIGKKVLVGAAKYFLDENLRAEQVVKMIRSCDVDFCRTFWALAENTFIYSMIKLTSPSVAIDHMMKLPCVHLCVNSVRSDHLIHVFAPGFDHPITARLISSVYRKGQEALFSTPTYYIPFYSYPPTADPSPYLLLHLHGGGFIGQSSASHELYLRDWAQKLGIPILSVDYSLAPEFKAPHQVEEAFYTYCWAKHNSHILGWTGAHLILVGDSAGANMAVALALKCLHLDIPQPDAIVSVYGCFCVEYCPSPSRILALMDPLIPMGVLAVCLQAYVGKMPEYQTAATHRNRTVSNLIPLHSRLQHPLSSQLFSHHKQSDSGFFDTSTTISTMSSSLLEPQGRGAKYVAFQIGDEYLLETISSEGEDVPGDEVGMRNSGEDNLSDIMENLEEISEIINSDATNCSNVDMGYNENAKYSIGTTSNYAQSTSISVFGVITESYTWNDISSIADTNQLTFSNNNLLNAKHDNELSKSNSVLINNEPTLKQSESSLLKELSKLEACLGSNNDKGHDSMKESSFETMEVPNHGDVNIDENDKSGKLIKTAEDIPDVLNIIAPESVGFDDKVKIFDKTIGENVKDIDEDTKDYNGKIVENVMNMGENVKSIIENMDDANEIVKQLMCENNDGIGKNTKNIEVNLKNVMQIDENKKGISENIKEISECIGSLSKSRTLNNNMDYDPASLPSQTASKYVKINTSDNYLAAVNTKIVNYTENKLGINPQILVVSDRILGSTVGNTKKKKVPTATLR